MALAPGTVVDRYILEGLLGEGGMAVVYRARHRDLGSLHAIKQLRIDQPSIRERLLQEGRLQSSLSHPNVVSVTDLVTLEGAPALVMEYIKGPSLADLLAQLRPSVIQCDAIARGILKGVAAAHAHGLVHRDLKPANILIAATEEEVIPKIADFGLAKLLEGATAPHAMTEAGTTMGTPGYMAPEQIMDASNVDRRADVFSLGAILYELVSGRHCFQGDGVMAIWQAICDGEFVPPKSQVPTLPERMVRAIEGALVVDREQRISKVSALLEVWSTNEEGARVPVLENSALELEPEAPRALAHALTLASSPDGDALAFDQTQDTVDILHPASDLATAPDHGPDAVTTPDPGPGTRPPGPASASALPWVLMGILLLIVAGSWWRQQQASDPEVQPSDTAAASAAAEAAAPLGSPSLYRLADGASADQRRQMATAQRALLDGEFALAERLLNAGLEARPKSGPLRSLLSLTHFFRGRGALSADESQRADVLARDQKGELSQVIRLGDRSWRELQKGRELLPQWQALRKGHPDDPMLELIYLVSARYILGPPQALVAIRAAAKKFPAHIVWTFLELHTLETMGQHAQKLQLAKQAYLRFPAATRLLMEVAKAQIHLGRLEEAEKNLKKVLSRDGSLIRARTLLAGIYVRTHDEQARLTQLTVGLGDTTPPLERLALLRNHGIALAHHGRLRAAEALWRHCLSVAQEGGNPNKALECADAALNASYWLLDVAKWQPWIKRMESILARPDLEPGLRQIYSLRLTWTKGTLAARTDDPASAEAVASSLRSMAVRGSILGVASHFEKLLRLEQLLAHRDQEGLRTIMAELGANTGKEGQTATCTQRFQGAVIAAALGDLAAADKALSSILAGDCTPTDEQGYVLATSRIQLAEIRQAQGHKGQAQELLDAFSKAWPAADEDLLLVKRAAALGR